MLEIIRNNGNYPIFSTDTEKVISHGEFVFIAVGTPPKANGEANLEYLQNAAENIGKFMQNNAIVINKSTVPVGSGNWVRMLVERGVEQRTDLAEYENSEVNGTGGTAVLDKTSSASGFGFTVASNPEFLREGTAILDTLYPDRIVIGTEDEQSATRLKALYANLKEQKFPEPSFCKRPEGFGEVPIISTDITSAEMIKYSANAFLSLKISFANQMANICDLVGADVVEVMHGIGSDSRIGGKFLHAGIGWGGSCFGKDVNALIKIAEEYGYKSEILEANKNVNYMQRDRIIRKLQNELKIVKGKKIGLLGLSFKPNTDDLRDAPALDIARSLTKLGAQVSATDPIAMPHCKDQNPDLNIDYKDSVDELVQDLDALILVTEWDQFKNLPMADIKAAMKGELFIDGRNQYQPKKMKELGFNYIGMGRRLVGWYKSPTAVLRLFFNRLCAMSPLHSFKTSQALH